MFYCLQLFSFYDAINCFHKHVHLTCDQ